MMGINHAMIGVATYLAVQNVFFEAPIDGLGIAAVVVGSLMPDVDHPKSIIGKKLFFISQPVSFFLGHRQITHSLLGILLFSFLALLITLLTPLEIYFVIPFAIGYAMHLVADYNTNSGVPWFWPNKKRWNAPWSFSTGGKVEYAIGLVLIAVLGFSFNVHEHFNLLAGEVSRFTGESNFSF